MINSFNCSYNLAFSLILFPKRAARASGAVQLRECETDRATVGQRHTKVCNALFG